MDKKEHLQKFNDYYYTYGREIADDLRRLKNIGDMVKKYWEVCRIFNKHKNARDNMSFHYSAGKSSSVEDDKYYSILKEYSGKVNQLEKTKNELVKINEVKKDVEKKENWKPIPETNDQEGFGKETYYCDECFGEKQGRHLYHKSKNDGHKLCSTECYKEHYGECCSRCINENKNFKKYLNVIQDGDNTYCHTCYKMFKQEQKEREEQEVRYCKYCSTKLGENNPFKFCQSDICLKKWDEEVINNKNSDHDKNQESRIKNQIANLEAKPTRTSQEEQELAHKKKELERLEQRLKELERKRKSNQDSQFSSENRNLGVKIGVGVGAVGVLLVLIVMVVKKKKN